MILFVALSHTEATQKPHPLFAYSIADTNYVEQTIVDPEEEKVCII